MDNPKEYFNSYINDFLINEAIHWGSGVDTPQQNGVFERNNKHILKVSRERLLSNIVPKRYWGDVVLIAGYLINRFALKNLEF